MAFRQGLFHPLAMISTACRTMLPHSTVSVCDCMLGATVMDNNENCQYNEYMHGPLSRASISIKKDHVSLDYSQFSFQLSHH